MELIAGFSVTMWAKKLNYLQNDSSVYVEATTSSPQNTNVTLQVTFEFLYFI